MVTFRKVRFLNFPFARYLVELIRRVEREDFAHLAAGQGVDWVVATRRSTPESASLLQDIEILCPRAGADFAITQVFFEDERYSALVDLAHLAGVDIPIIPGIMPVTFPEAPAESLPDGGHVDLAVKRRTKNDRRPTNESSHGRRQPAP